uniref:Protein P n=1 Tax=African cichlid hepadnavirus TaxID=1862821 RepID=A0A193AUJ1_9HEPA|nr:polymerase [African cichlid hepadnavirus]
MVLSKLNTMLNKSPCGKILLKRLGEINPNLHHSGQMGLQEVKDLLDLSSGVEVEAVAGDVVHSLPHAKGLYQSNQPSEFNPNWKIPSLTEIVLKDTIKEVVGKRITDKFFPVRLWTGKRNVKTKPKCKGVAPHYDKDPRHITVVNKYLNELYHAGVLYKRISRNKFLVSDKAQLYPWESSREVRVKGQIQDRCHGHAFCVRKNVQDNDNCRLVVDMSSHSRHMKEQGIKLPKYFTPSVKTISRTLRPHQWHMSLDLKNAFYSFPMHPESSVHLLVSDTANVYGFRKLPMGHWISPFVLQMFTARIAEWARKKFKVMVIAYMDDFLISHKHPRIVKKVCTAIQREMQRHGLQLNVDKSTPEPTRTPQFIGIQVGRRGLLPQARHWQLVRQQLQEIKGQHVDYKIIQKVLGLLNWTAPFTPCGIHPILPLYKRASREWSTKIPDHLYELMDMNWRKPMVVRYQTNRPNKVFVDASSKGLGIQHKRTAVYYSFDGLHINKAELLAAALGCDYANHVVTDSTYVFHHKFNTMPVVVACLFAFLFREVTLSWVCSKDNPADSPSRGHPVVTPFKGVLRGHARTRREKLTKLSESYVHSLFITYSIH